MTDLRPEPPDPATRRSLHRVAAHVLGRRRWQVTGRFGLRAAPGGFATPAFGDGPEVLRVAGDRLVREVAGARTAMALDGATLGGLAAFAGADLGAPLDLGGDAPPLGDPGEALTVDAGGAEALGRWLWFGWTVIDTVLATGEASVLQLWPEHFDAGCDVAAGAGRVNLGASPGDAGVDQPYLYVGPWGPERPGDPGYWNAGFGAVLTAGDLAGDPDRRGRAVAWMREGLGRLDAG